MQDFAREALLFIVIKHLPTPNEELGEKISNLFEHKIGKTLEFGLNSVFFIFIPLLQESVIFLPCRRAVFWGSAQKAENV